MTPSLYELALKYNSDKFHFHSYISFYENLFAVRSPATPVMRLLEIGIGYEDLMKPLVPKYTHGSSLYMWRDFFPDAEIFSCDIRPDTLINEDRIHSMTCDQSEPLDLLRMIGEFGGNFDVIIDDGSHLPEHQILTARTLLPYLAVGGAYVIEDIGLSNLSTVARAVGGGFWEGSKRDDDNLVLIRDKRDIAALIKVFL